MTELNVGETRKILSSDGSETGEYFIVLDKYINIDQANDYSRQSDNAFKFSEPIDPIKGIIGYQRVKVGFNKMNGKLDLETEYTNNGGSRRSKPSKQRSATRRRRSSKRMSRKMNKRRR
jgi:hypothetical protein